MNKIYSSKEITLQKLQHYCAYQDRSQKQVEKKLYELKCGREIAGEITLELIKSGYLNEERFARSFVRGKFRINHWGKKNFPTFCTRKNLMKNTKMRPLNKLYL